MDRSPLDDVLIPKRKGKRIQLWVLLLWGFVVLAGIVFKMMHWPMATWLMLAGFCGYSGYALYALVYFENPPVARWMLAIPALVIPGIILYRWLSRGIEPWEYWLLVCYLALVGISFLVMIVLHRKR